MNFSGFAVWPFPGVWPIAGATAPNVKPPANAAPLLRNPLRSDLMGVSFADELPRNRFLPIERIVPRTRSERGQYRIYQQRRSYPFAGMSRLHARSSRQRAARVSLLNAPISFGTTMPRPRSLRSETFMRK